MNSSTIGKVRTVPLRDVWPHEAHDFTIWLEQNCDRLSRRLGIKLENVRREQAAGSFSVDLVAESEDGKVVVIENQLERTNHDHLGKLITYLAMRQAEIAVWIVSEVRHEHAQAISKLNEGNIGDFYLVIVEAIRIDDSLPAPIFTIITGPDIEAREVGDAKRKDLVGRQIKRREFWERLLSQHKTPDWHSSISARTSNWFGTSRGLPSGIYLGYRVRRHESQVELLIDLGTEESTGQMFQKLLDVKNEIEIGCGERLHWQPAEEGRRSRRLFRIVDGGWRDEQMWDQIHQELVAVMIRFEAEIRPRISHAN